MSLKRIYTVFLRYLYATRDPSRITEFIVWPMIDVGFFGLIAYWSGQVAGNQKLLQNFITGLILWQIIYRSNFEICVNVLDEFVEKNLINLIGSPLKKREWITGMMISGMLKIIFTLLFGSFLGWFFFRVNVYELGWSLFPFVILCLLSGWMIGFLSAGIVIYKGSKLVQLPWVIITIAAIFSNTYYPLSVFPPSLKVIAQSLPMSYIFEGMREMLAVGTISNRYWILGTILSFIYLAVAIYFFLYMFEKSRKRGLTRLP
jgi:ABC-2 type transport system permease protein